MEKVTYTTTELTKRFNVDRRTIARWRKELKFPAPFSFGRYFVSDVETWERNLAHYQETAES
jgi:predicted DNA-binding transcriptional regulator AlpA